MKKNTIQNIKMSNIAIYVAGDKIGDAILKYPVIRAFKEALPVPTKIIWITGNEPSAFFDQLSFLNRQIIDHFFIENDSISNKERRTIFEQYQIQCLINTESRIKTGIKLKTFHKGMYICPALNYLFSDIKPKTQSKNDSIFDRFYALLSLATKKKLRLNFDIDIPKPYQQYTDEILPDDNYIGFSLGASGYKKAWPLEHFIELARLKDKYSFKPVFFLGPNEDHLKKRLKTVISDCRIIPSNNLPNAINSVPLLTISAAKKLSFSVANDSGGGHLLACGRKPLLTLFGKNRAKKFLSPYCDQKCINTEDFGKKNVVDLEFKPVYDEFVNMIRSVRSKTRFG